MKRLSNSCKRQREGISLLAAGALPEPERPDVENHLASCADCQKYYNQMEGVVRPFARWEDGLAGITPSESAGERWKAAIMAAASPTRPALYDPWAVYTQWWRETIWPHRHAWAGMAAAWLVMWVVNERTLGSPNTTMGAMVNSGPGLLQAIEDENQILAELSPAPVKQPAEPPRRDALAPRSEKALPWKAC